MNQIACCDWLPEWERCSYSCILPTQDYLRVSQEKFPQKQTINLSLTKLFQSRWLDIDLILFFCEFMDLASVSVHKHAKKNLANIQPS